MNEIVIENKFYFKIPYVDLFSRLDSLKQDVIEDLKRQNKFRKHRKQTVKAIKISIPGCFSRNLLY